MNQTATTPRTALVGHPSRLDKTLFRHQFADFLIIHAGPISPAKLLKQPHAYACVATCQTNNRVVWFCLDVYVNGRCSLQAAAADTDASRWRWTITRGHFYCQLVKVATVVPKHSIGRYSLPCKAFCATRCLPVWKSSQTGRSFAWEFIPFFSKLSHWRLY